MARTALTAALATFIGLAFWIGVIGFLSAEAVGTVRERLALPEKEEVQVDWGEPCITSMTNVCREYRGEKRLDWRKK